ncbi:VOC family protein [Piscinibacter sp.]|uniref:VOC family protein n=1 Tax=Piscinibacter sp. TaxID=1903157 RepID=UPI00391FAC47
MPAVPPARGAIPYLVVKGASDAIGYYQRVFGAKLLFKLDAPDGSILHSEIEVGPAHFMVTEENKQYGSLSPLTLGGSSTTAVLYVPDADATIKAAVAAGAKVGMPVGDQFWGDRSGSITDPFGHQWFISTHKEDPSPEEIQRRVAALFAKGAPC